MEVDEAFRVAREIRYHLQGRTVRGTIGGNATSFWMVGKKFRAGWVDHQRNFLERQAGGH